MPRVAVVASVLFLSLPLVGTGCVQQSEYDSLMMANNSLKEQAVVLEQDRDEARANLDTVRDQLNRTSAELAALMAKYKVTAEDLERLGVDYDALASQAAGLNFGPLPAAVNQALRDLASQYPDMLTFDEQRGMLRFSSDFTFASGSAELSSSAAASLSKLAQILNSDVASDLEIHCVGHTDNVPISKAPTRQQHPTNRHLSVHRAISVCESLDRNGVNADRMMVAGYGEFRPAVPNPAKGGAAENRRVEIFLRPMPEGTSSSGAAPSTVATPERVGGEPMK